MTSPVCLVTGGNAGIGRAAALQLARAGARVVIACRSPERADRAVADLRAAVPGGSVAAVEMDLSSSASIASGCDAFRALGHRTVDVLIHNAADFDLSRSEPQPTDDGVESIWATNHLGPVRLTHALDAELAASAQGRVITVSSKGLMLYPFLRIDLDDPEFRRGGFSVQRAYYRSKLAQVMYTDWLARRYRGDARTANCVRVTNVRIDLDRYPGLTPMQQRLYALKSRFAISADRMAETYTWLALSPDLRGVSGGYVDENRRPVRPGAWAADPRNVEALMAATARYVPGLLDPAAA